MIFLRVFKHLLPNARAWRLTVDKKLRQFFDGLSNALGPDEKSFFDGVWSDIFPQSTREIGAWETQFGLANTGAAEQARRDRLEAAWKATGGQSPRYIQDTLRANGFDVYVHDWWPPGSEPQVGVKGCVSARNPLLVLRKTSEETGFQVTAGNPAATCGNPAATCGSTLTPAGYPLVNKVFSTVPDYTVTAGNPAATCGNPAATCGHHTSFKQIQKNYTVPADPAKWPYFFYIGGQNYPDVASVLVSRKDEFEDLCLKICPAQLWLGVLVKYN